MSSVAVNASAVQAQSSKQNAFSSTSPSSFMAVSLGPRVISGSFGSIVSAFVTTPMEVVKVKLQRYRPPATSSTTATSTSPVQIRALSAAPTGPVSMLRHVIATEGVQGVYAGLAPTMIMSIPNYLLYLLSYDELVDAMRVHTSLSETSIPLAGGAIARLIATSATAPLEMLRTRMASVECRQKQSDMRVWTELRTIVRNDGVPALYRGVMPQLLRDVPFAALYMLFLERCRDLTRPLLLADNNSNTLSTTDTSTRQEMKTEFISAAAAGMVAASCTAPLDVVKTRFQSHCSSGTSNNKSMHEVALSIVQREGIAGLWRGNQARMMKVAPQYAIMISCYEVGKKVLA